MLHEDVWYLGPFLPGRELKGSGVDVWNSGSQTLTQISGTNPAGSDWIVWKWGLKILSSTEFPSHANSAGLGPYFRFTFLSQGKKEKCNQFNDNAPFPPPICNTHTHTDQGKGELGVISKVNWALTRHPAETSVLSLQALRTELMQ